MTTMTQPCGTVRLFDDTGPGSVEIDSQPGMPTSAYVDSFGKLYRRLAVTFGDIVAFDGDRRRWRALRTGFASWLVLRGPHLCEMNGDPVAEEIAPCR